VEDKEVQCALEKGWWIRFAHVRCRLVSYDGLGYSVVP
jgi:hypothetical protein